MLLCLLNLKILTIKEIVLPPNAKINYSKQSADA